MNLSKYLVGILSLLLLMSSAAFAQEEMTIEEWQAEINRLTEKKAAMTNELNGLQTEVNELKAKYEGLQEVEDCEDELYKMVGATDNSLDAFRSKLSKLEGMINRREGPKADRQAELDQLKDNPISALPEFYNKVHIELQRKLDAWIEKPKEVMYTVVKGDCLWYIAKRNEHYGNGFAWPIIYKANRDEIKNPDLIYPKQVFKIPNLTDEEKAKYDKIRRNYKPAPVE